LVGRSSAEHSAHNGILQTAFTFEIIKHKFILEQAIINLKETRHLLNQFSFFDLVSSQKHFNTIQKCISKFEEMLVRDKKNPFNNEFEIMKILFFKRRYKELESHLANFITIYKQTEKLAHKAILYLEMLHV